MMSRSSNKNRFNNFPLIGSRQSRLSRQNYSPKVSEKCMNCKDYGVCASCLTCSNIMCVNCALMHSKDLINHRVMDIKEAYRSSYDIIKQMEHKIRLLMQNIKPNPHDQRNKINGQLFEESFQKIKNLRKQIEQLVTSFFEQIQNNYLSMWNSFVEVWGSGSALKDRMSSTQKKLQGYLFEDQLDEVQCLVYLFNNQLIEETQSLIEAWERKQNTNLDFEQSQILIPPRAQFDLTHLTKLEFDLNLLVQIISWNIGQQDIISIEGKERATIPIFPVGSKSMFIYHTDTREYQLGDFPDLKAVQMPFFSKQILIDDNNLFVIGGSDSKGVPMKSVIQFKDGDLVSLPSIPQGKNPSNGLVYDNDVIYVIGGMKIIDDKIQWCKSCEMYLIKENKWMSLEEMKFKKPFQTVFKINNFIYALGQQLNDILNFEKLDLTEHNWQMINIQNHSINPYMFGLGYLSATINSSQVLIFGGKQFIKRTIDDATVSTDEDVIKTVFLYDINLNQFISLGDKLPGTGVNYGDYAPIVLKNKVIYLETPLAKVRKLQRWLSYVNIIEISLSENGIESSVVQMLTPE